MTRSSVKIFLAALLCSFVFFYEYLPPVRSVHIPYDLDGYHFSLAAYGFQAVHQGRLPQWDPSIYGGMSFLANVQSAFFYPGTWLMYLATWGRERLSYQALVDLDLAHVALAFTLCVVWLRNKKLSDPAALLGAAVYAFSGYLCTQLQHFGLVVTYAWMPLALLGIDQSAERESVKPMWKVVVAASLAFLGGYPPTWVVFAMVAGTYAWVSPGRLRTVPATVLAFVFALCVCGVQVLPTWDATHFREPEPRYGLGIKDIGFYLSYLIPNYWDFGLNVPVLTNLGKDYLYLGAPGIVGLALAWRRGVAVLPALAVLLVSLLFAINPFNVVWNAIEHQPLLMDILRSYYFLAGAAIAFAELAAHGLDWFLEQETKPSTSSMKSLAISILGAWAVIEIVRWKTSGFLAGGASLIDMTVSLGVFSFGLFVLRGLDGKARMWMLAALLVSVGVDYKVFGTSKRFNASAGDGPRFSATELGAMNKEAVKALRPPSDYRVLLQELAPLPNVVRHQGWISPQGFDPFLSSQYRELGAKYGKWDDDRALSLDPLNPDVMRIFGIRYVITGEQGSKYTGMLESPSFRMVGANDNYYKVFEYLDAKPIYQFPGKLEVVRRDPEDRVLTVESPEGGLLTFSEQFYPGWSVKVDDKYYPLEKWETAFQAVRIDKGKHTVELKYEERLLRVGAALSIVSLLILTLWIALSSGSIYSRANPAASE